MSSSTRGRATARTSARLPELDMARSVALVAGIALLVAPGRLPTWVDSVGLDVRTLLPACVVVVAGAAAALQRATRAGSAPAWWAARLGRRLVVLAAAGAVLVLVTTLPDLPTDPRALLVTNLTGLGLVALVALACAGLSVPTRLGVAVVTVAAAGAAPATWWQLPPLLAASGTAVVGSVLGDVVRAAPRGASTVLRVGGLGLLLVVVGGAMAGQLQGTGRWSPATIVAATGVVAVTLAVGQAGTRRATTDRVVATLAVAGRAALPLWVGAVVTDALLLGTPPVRWLLRTVLWPPLGDDGAVLALALLVGLALVRLGGAIVDRDLPHRA